MFSEDIFADNTFWSKKTDRNKSVRLSPYFLIWPIHPTAYGGGGILGSYVKKIKKEKVYLSACG